MRTLLQTVALLGIAMIGIAHAADAPTGRRGPDLTTGVFEHGRTIGFLNFRYYWESGARSSFEGGTLFASFTIARLAK